MMSNFKERLTKEYMELVEKINKLENFIIGDIFTSIDPIQQSLLKVQLKAMQTYEQCLTERMSAL